MSVYARLHMKLYANRSGLSEHRLPEDRRRKELEDAAGDQIVDRLGHDRELVAGETASAHVALRVVVTRAGEHPAAAHSAEDESH